MTAPCKDCPDRQSHCHSKCEKYLKFFEKNEKRKEALRRENNKFNADVEYAMALKKRLR